MNARILALGAMVVLTASAVDAQSPKGKGGLGRGKATADSSVRKGSDDDRNRSGSARGRSNDADDRPMSGPGGMNHRSLFAGITLTDAQKTQVKAIREQYRPRMIAIRDSARVSGKDGERTATDSAYRARAVTLAASERGELRAVLTTEQQVKFDANVKRMDDRMAKRSGSHGKGNGRSGDRPGRPRP